VSATVSIPWQPLEEMTRRDVSAQFSLDPDIVTLEPHAGRPTCAADARHGVSSYNGATQTSGNEAAQVETLPAAGTGSCQRTSERPKSEIQKQLHAVAAAR
jgi:hypothetical protein